MESFWPTILTVSGLLALLLALYSFVVYFFRLSFLSIAVSHAVLAGLALGVVTGLDPTAAALVFSVAVGWLVAFLRRRVGLTEDASVGIVLALSMAVGIILIYLSSHRGNVFAYLFGSLTTVSTADGVVLFFLLLVSAFLAYRYKDQVLFLCFDEETAYSTGIRTGVLYYSMVALLAFLITYATKLVGILLTHAMLVVPTAAAYQLVWHYGKLLLLSGGVSLASTYGGLALAYLLDLPTGPSIVLTGGGIFLLFSLLGFLKRKRGR
ncbi:MAG: metal ABC transporter permease [Aquificae bacterium]|nr:metal ABC transporter permease [Aquificota bacterium]